MNRRKILLAGVALGGLLFLPACNPEPQRNQARTEQSQRAADAASSIRFNANSEIDNIRRRLELTSDPTLLGYIILMNEAGQPIIYEGVRGKVTSGGKRLTEEDRLISTGNGSGGSNMAVRRAPSDEGTHGSSAPYIFYWNADGTYRQWSGHYLYSTQPIRLRVEPLVMSVAPAQ